MPRRRAEQRPERKRGLEAVSAAPRQHIRRPEILPCPRELSGPLVTSQMAARRSAMRL